MKTNIPKWLTVAAAFGFAAGAMAAPFSVKYTDTASTSGPGLGIISGQQATITLFLDNGNSSVANQTWSAANLKCITFTFNNAQNLFVTINYSGSPLGSNPTATTLGNFTTNASGVLLTVPTDWEDTASPIPNPTVSNIAITPVNNWFIDGLNEVLDGNGTHISFTNVHNDIIASNWSNPVPSGVCAGAPPPPPPTPTPTQPIPTLTEWGVVVLSSLLVLGAVFSLRRRRQ